MKHSLMLSLALKNQPSVFIIYLSHLEFRQNAALSENFHCHKCHLQYSARTGNLATVTALWCLVEAFKSIYMYVLEFYSTNLCNNIFLCNFVFIKSKNFGITDLDKFLEFIETSLNDLWEYQRCSSRILPVSTLIH